MVPRRSASVNAPGALPFLPLALAISALLTGLLAAPLGAQQSLRFSPSGYAINVGAASGDSPFAAGGVSDFQRLREMLKISANRFTVDIAYEQTLLLAESQGGVTTGLLPPRVGNNWWDLGWTVDEGDRFVVRHRVDRAAMTILAGPLEATVGRQAVSWASTLFLTPADPFSPFDPTDPFREYRAGIDALRIRWSTGPFSDIDIVLRPTRGPQEDQMTALVRAQTNWRGWDLSAWGGALYDRGAAAAQLVGSLGSWAVRTEVSIRDQPDGTVLRTALGVDRRLMAAGKELYLILEFQHDGFGARDGELTGILSSPAAGRGELQVFSANAVAAQSTYTLHPLVSVDLLALWSLTDGSVLLGPGLTWSATSIATIRVGSFLGADPGGSGREGAGVLLSEFGDAPAVGYVSASFYF
jgi:hypothetical protein